MPLKQFSDEELFALVSTTGSHSAYEELFRRHYGDLIKYAYLKMGDFSTSEDIVHDVLLSIWKRRRNIVIQKTMKSYFLQAIKYKVADEINKQQSRKEYIKSLELPQEKTTDYKVREAILKERIDQEINKLPKRMKEVFVLSRERNMTHQEIADHLGLSVHTVSTQIKKTLKLLRSRLMSFILFLF